MIIEIKPNIQVENIWAILKLEEKKRKSTRVQKKMPQER